MLSTNEWCMQQFTIPERKLTKILQLRDIVGHIWHALFEKWLRDEHYNDLENEESTGNMR